MPPRATRSLAGLVALVAAVAAMVLAGSCTTSPTPSAAPGTSGTAGTSGPQRGDGRRVAEVAAASSLLTRVATEGADAVFEHRFGGALDAGAEAGAFVYVGRVGGEAVVYVCDGTTGAWFVGPVDGDGGGAIAQRGGDATATLAPGEDGVHVRFTGGAFDGRETTAIPLEDGDETLLRLEAPADAGGPDAAVGGVIISAAGVRGVLTVTDGTSNTVLVTEIPGAKSTDTTAPPNVLGTAPPGSSVPVTRRTPSIADGQSNTIDVGEAPPGSTPRTQQSVVLGDGSVRTVDPSSPSTQPAITDGQSNTISVGEATGSTTTTVASITDGNSNTIIVGEGTPGAGTAVAAPGAGGSSGATLVVSKTSGGILSVRVTAGSATAVSSSTSSTTAAPSKIDGVTTSSGTACATQVAAIAALIRSLTDTLKAMQRQLEVLREQRRAVDATPPSPTRDAARLRLDRSIDAVQRQQAHVVAQIDDLRKQIPTCR